MCGVFSFGIVLVVLLSYFEMGSPDKRIALFVLAIVGIAMMIITQKDEYSKSTHLKVRMGWK